MSRLMAALIEQGLWSLLNLGLNVVLIRLIAPDQYGLYVFWANCGFVLSSFQNALTLCHLQILPPADGHDPRRRAVEEIMAGTTLVFLLLVAGLTALADRLLAGGGLSSPAAVLFLPAFLLQQYIRALAFARGQATTAAVQTGLVLVLASGFLLVFALLPGMAGLDGGMVLLALGLGYGLVGLAGAGRAWRGLRPRLSLRQYRPYARQSAWVFLGVTTTELLARFYAFVVAGWFGPVALATLSATQLPLRPIPLLINAWSMVGRNDLVNRREAGDWAGFRRLIAQASAGGVLAALALTTAVYLLWPAIAGLIYGGKYLDDGWMTLLWGLSMGLSAMQAVANTGLQVLKAFGRLALANALAAATAMAAILAALALAGFWGAIPGTIAGQALELAVMVIMLRRLVPKAPEGGSPAGGARRSGCRPAE